MDRADFLKKIKSYLPGGPVCVELGVLRGDFSQLILDILNPYRLYLVDPFTTGGENKSKGFYGSGEHTMPTAYSTQDDYWHVAKRFNGDKRVIIKSAFSYDAVFEFQFNYFDLVYIDASHLYESVKCDLNDYMPKLKKTGLMCGHDYGNINDFGVKKAVDEFMMENNYKMIALSQENDWALIKN